MNNRPALPALSILIAIATLGTSATNAFTTYQTEIREVSIMEAQGVIDRTIGSGTVDRERGEFVLEAVRAHVSSASQEWFAAHTGARIMG